MTSSNRSADPTTIGPKYHNRVAAIMVHVQRYWSRGASRLATDAGVSKSTISHLLRGKSNPLYTTTRRVVKCLERELGLPLHPDEVLSEDGSYPTTQVCRLVGCPGCLPEVAYQRDNAQNPVLLHVKAGQWTGDNFEFEYLSKPERSE